MITKRILFSLAFAVFVLATAALLNYAKDSGIVGDDLARRIIQVIIGLALALYANFMPKDISRSSRTGRAAALAQTAVRVGGWLLTLAGLIYAGLWAFAPLAIADIASMVVVATALAVTLGFAVWAFTACRRAEDRSTAR